MRPGKFSAALCGIIASFVLTGCEFDYKDYTGQNLRDVRERNAALENDLTRTQGELAQTRAALEKSQAALPEAINARNQALLDLKNARGEANISMPSSVNNFSPLIGTKVERITLPNGKTYENATVTRMESDGITITHPGGVQKILFSEMPPDLRKKFEPSR